MEPEFNPTEVKLFVTFRPYIVMESGNAKEEEDTACATLPTVRENIRQ